MCKECGCGETGIVTCTRCGGQMAIVDGEAVCTVCNAIGDAHALAHLRGEHHHHAESEGHTHTHEHPHDHEHTHAHPHVHAPAPDELTRVRILLPHWLEQNHDRLRDLRSLATTTRALGKAEAGALIAAAIAQIEASEQQLSEALHALEH